MSRPSRQYVYPCASWSRGAAARGSVGQVLVETPFGRSSRLHCCAGSWCLVPLPSRDLSTVRIAKIFNSWRRVPEVMAPLEENKVFRHWKFCLSRDIAKFTQSLTLWNFLANSGLSTDRIAADTWNIFTRRSTRGGDWGGEDFVTLQTHMGYVKPYFGALWVKTALKIWISLTVFELWMNLCW